MIPEAEPCGDPVLSPPVQAYGAWLTMRASRRLGDAEFTSMETYKEVAEVNLWGHCGRSLPPLIRRAKGKVEGDPLPAP